VTPRDEDFAVVQLVACRFSHHEAARSIARRLAHGAHAALGRETAPSDRLPRASGEKKWSGHTRAKKQEWRCVEAERSVVGKLDFEIPRGKPSRRRRAPVPHLSFSLGTSKEDRPAGGLPYQEAAGVLLGGAELVELVELC
jgi:hypothetical protein